MNEQLLLSKRLFEEASRFEEQNDAVSCGLAISLLQDSAELLTWALIKHRNVSTRDQSGFTTNLELLERDGALIPQKSKLLELNKARVGFKHYGNLPNPTEATKFRTYVEDFLRETMQREFSVDWDSLSLVDLLPYAEVRARLKDAETSIASGDLNAAVMEASVAKVMLFALLGRFVPTVDHSLGQVDRALAQVPELQGTEPFTYLVRYLEMLREIALISFLGFPLTDYQFLKNTLYEAHKSMNGKWTVYNNRPFRLSEEICRKQIKCLVAFGIRTQAMLRTGDA